MAELGENTPVYSLLHQIKNYQILKSLWYSVLFYERKNWNFCVILLNTKDRKGPIYLYNGLWLDGE